MHAHRTSGQTALSYRPDVDGLRAIAVLSVLAFHAYPLLLPGGFIGVDVFFVISGFLISGIIFRQLEKDRFSFLDFYIRRIKRIFPSLILVLLASLLLGWFVLLRDEYINLGKHVAAGAGFLSNIVYWREIDYFDGAAESKPLLHLWSLGVEEQFYIIWPPLLWFVWKRHWNVERVIWLIVIVSFCTNVWSATRMPAATFYLPVTRLWELLVGSWLAYRQILRRQDEASDQNRVLLTIRSWSVSRADFKAICGLTLIGVALLAFSNQHAYPGWRAVLPIVGTFLLISASQEAWINRTILSYRVFVAIGLISYPLYLWHWPLVAFGRFIAADNSKVLISAVLLSFLLSWLTTRFVEQPIRLSSRGPVKMLACLALGLGIIALIGVAGNFGVIASRLDTPAINDLIIASKDWQFPKDENFQKDSAFRLVEQPGTTKSTVLFIGDSHVEQYFPRVKYLTSRRDLKSYSAVFATHEGCPPIPDINLIEPGFYCHKFSEFALDEAKKSAVARVVFSGFWERYFIHEYSAPKSGTPVYYTKDPAGRQVRIYDALGVEVFRNFAARISSLRRAGKRVYIILSNPTAPAFEPRSMLIDRLRLGHAAVNTNGFIAKTEFQHHVRPMTAILKYIAESTGSTVFDPLDYFCEDLVCRTNTADGKPKYRDSDHLRSSYAETRATFVDQIILHQPNAAQASHLVTEITPKSLHEPTF